MLEVLDTAGQEEYTALRDQWIRDGEGFVLVYSISSRSSFSRIQKFHSQIQRVKESVGAASPTGLGYAGGYGGSPMSPHTSHTASPPGEVPIMLVGNKSDRVTEREVSTQEGHALARQLGCEFVEASAKNCVNVERAFYDVVRQLRRQRQQSNPRAPERHRPIIGSSGSGSEGGIVADLRRGSKADRSTKSHRSSIRCVIL